MIREQSLGIRPTRPIPAIIIHDNVRTREQDVQKLMLAGARRRPSGYRATWYCLTTDGNRALYGPVYERPDDDTIAEVQEELREIERERQALLARLAERRRNVLARLTPIPNDKTDEIVAWVAAREAQTVEHRNG